MMIFNLFKGSVSEQKSKKGILSDKLNYKAPSHNLSKTDAIQILLKLARFYSQAIVNNTAQKPLYINKLAKIKQEITQNSDNIADKVILEYFQDYLKHGLK